VTQQQTLEEARRVAAEAAEAAKAAERELERQVAEADARRQAALLAIDRQRLAEHDPAAMIKEISAKREAYRAALREEPWIKALAEYVAVLRIRMELEDEARRIRIGLGQLAPDSPQPNWTADPPNILDEVFGVVRSLAADLAEDILAPREEQRTEAGERAARGEA
jgi:hypothetical protein